MRQIFQDILHVCVCLGLFLPACVCAVLHIVLLMQADTGIASSLKPHSLELERGKTQNSENQRVSKMLK